MPFAIEMFLDAESAETVRGVWRDLAESGVAPWMHESGARPHVTLGVCERLDVDACAGFLADFAAVNRAPSVRFSSIGVFATDPAVVFLAPVVTADLLDLHARFQEQFITFAGDRWAYYLPEQWVPHCTLAMECPIAMVSRVVDLCRAISLPLDSRLEEVAIVEFRPVVLRRTFRFAGS
ncbi:MAG: 2'-5' RNA ligase family protein [Thermomicrobiales bacterium]